MVRTENNSNKKKAVQSWLNNSFDCKRKNRIAVTEKTGGLSFTIKRIRKLTSYLLFYVSI